MIYYVMIGLIVLASLLMCGIVLIQESKGGGLASSFSASNSIMGVRKTTDFLEKGTWFLAAFMVLCSIVCAYTLPEPKDADSAILNEQAAPQQAPQPQQAAPAGLPGGQANGAAAAPGQGQAPLKAPAQPAK